MKVLFIGGTGNISTATSRLAASKGMDLYLLNRGNNKTEIPGASSITANIHEAKEVVKALGGQEWDCVVDWIAFHPGDVDRDIELFAGKTKQYIFISSASAYQKPLSNHIITEKTPLYNPYWDYSRNKIACEERLLHAYRQNGFPMTIVRPSLTYDTVIPAAFASWDDYTLIDRIKKGGRVIVHGDGSSLWTCTHAEDFARGFVGLIGHPQAIGQSFHITSDEVLTWNQIYEAIAAAAGAELKAVHIASDFIIEIAKHYGQDWLEGNFLGDKSVSAVFDNSKIKHFVPEFKAIIPFAEGIKRTVEWFEADPSRMKIVDENNQLMDRIIEAYER